MTTTATANRVPRVVPPAARRADPAVARFEAGLPAWGYASDAKRADAWLPRDRAVGCARLQPNLRAQLRWLVFDVDRPGVEAVWAWKDALLPPPSFTVSTVNPDGGLGNAHVFYELIEPVCRTGNARPGPLAYAAAVEAALREGLGADPGYTGLLCKNPLHPEFHVVVFRDGPRSLGELADQIALKPRRFGARPRDDVAGLGRNCHLFEHGRVWAYGEVGAYRDAGAGRRRPEHAWRAAVWTQLRELNKTFERPLPPREVAGVAKSIAVWTWRRYRGRGAGSGVVRGRFAKECTGKTTAEKQAIAGRLVAVERAGATDAKIAAALAELRAGGDARPTQARLAEASGVRLRTVKGRWAGLLVRHALPKAA